MSCNHSYRPNKCIHLFFVVFCSLQFRPNNIIPSAVAADLASHPSVRGSSKSLGTVTGLINGCGSVTSAIGLLAIGPLQSAFGWPAVWVYLIVCTATGMCLLGSKIYEEIFPSSGTDSAKVCTNIQA